jgi:hypothetical protein
MPAESRLAVRSSEEGTTVSSLPFSVSAEAAAFIVEQLRKPKKRPIPSGLLPALFFAFDSRTYKGQQLVECCPIPFFEIGWYSSETVAQHGFEEIDLCGEKIYASEDTVNRLAGKTLILETLEAGFPNPADRKAQYLRPT